MEEEDLLLLLLQDGNVLAELIDSLVRTPALRLFLPLAVPDSSFS